MPHNKPRFRKSQADQMVRAFDLFTHSLTTIDSDHRVIHDGRGFTVSVDGMLPAAGSATLMAVIPQGTWMHWRFGAVGVDDTPVRIELRDKVVTASDGAAVPIKNNNRSVDLQSDCEVHISPIITDPGELLMHDVVRGDTSPNSPVPVPGMIDNLGSEWIFHDDKVTLTIHNLNSTEVGYTGRFFWYEIDEQYAGDV